MRIAIFSDNFYPEISGISDSLILLGKELAKLGQQVYFFAPRYSALDFTHSKLPVQELELGPNIKIIRFRALSFTSSPTGQSRIALPTFWRWRLVKKYRVDIIHTNSCFGMGIEAWLAAKILKLPLVGTNHTPIRQFLAYSPIQAAWPPKVSAKFANGYYNQCALVTAPSDYMLTEMLKDGLKVPSQVVSNPLDITGFKPASEAEKAELKNEFLLAKNTVLYTGRLAPEKNIDVIIRAIQIVKKEIPDISLALTGHGSAAASLQKLVADLKLQGDVNFLGHVEISKLKRLYQAADIFSIMSTAETQSLSMMQAMASGLPIIAARAGALPEYVGENRGYLVEPGDYAELARKIIGLCRDAWQRKYFGAQGLAFAQTIAAPRIAEKWLTIYQTIINKAKS